LIQWLTNHVALLSHTSTEFKWTISGVSDGYEPTKKTKPVTGIYEFAGIRAANDFDGYTCWLAYKDLTITLLFHGKYDFDYKDEDTLKAFFKKIAVLIADRDNL